MNTFFFPRVLYSVVILPYYWQGSRPACGADAITVWLAQRSSVPATLPSHSGLPPPCQAPATLVCHHPPRLQLLWSATHRSLAHTRPLEGVLPLTYYLWRQFSHSTTSLVGKSPVFHRILLVISTYIFFVTFKVSLRDSGSAGRPDQAPGPPTVPAGGVGVEVGGPGRQVEGFDSS